MDGKVMRWTERQAAEHAIWSPAGLEVPEDQLRNCGLKASEGFVGGYRIIT